MAEFGIELADRSPRSRRARAAAARSVCQCPPPSCLIRAMRTESLPALAGADRGLASWHQLGLQSRKLRAVVTGPLADGSTEGAVSRSKLLVSNVDPVGEASAAGGETSTEGQTSSNHSGTRRASSGRWRTVAATVCSRIATQLASHQHQQSQRSTALAAFRHRTAIQFFKDFKFFPSHRVGQRVTQNKKSKN